MSRSTLILLAALTTMGMTATVADGIAEDRRATYEYTADEVNAAAKTDLDLALAPLRLAGKLNRNTPEFERVHHLFAQVIDVAMHRSDFAPKLEWAVYVHEGRLVEAYSRTCMIHPSSENLCCYRLPRGFDRSLRCFAVTK